MGGWVGQRCTRVEGEGEGIRYKRKKGSRVRRGHKKMVDDPHSFMILSLNFMPFIKGCIDFYYYSRTVFSVECCICTGLFFLLRFFHFSFFISLSLPFPLPFADTLRRSTEGSVESSNCCPVECFCGALWIWLVGEGLFHLTHQASHPFPSIFHKAVSVWVA